MDDNLFTNLDNITTFDDILKSLNDSLNRIEIKKELPKGCLYIQDNVSKDGKLTSRSICIHEPYYPSPYGDEIHDNWIDTVITFSFKKMSKEGNCCIFTVNQSILNKIGIIGSPKIFAPSKNSDMLTLRYQINDPNLLIFMNKRILYAIEHYCSPDDSFSCCHRYLQCSDAKKCLHPNKLYSTACIYRHNLEKGRIFYGKNKNIFPENKLI